MMTVALPQIGDGRGIITHSRNRSYRSCPRKHYHAYELGIRRAVSAKPLRMGIGCHLGVELVRKHGKTVDEAIALATADYDSLPAWAEDHDAQTEWYVEGETVRRMLAGYFWRYADSPIEIVAAEQTIVMPLRNPETGHKSTVFDFAGKVDNIVKLDPGTPTERLAVMEMKTASEDIGPESDYWRKLRIDQQVSTEAMLARHAGYDVVTTIYDVLRKPSIRPKKLSKPDRQALVNTRTYFGETVEIDPENVPERETPAMFGARLNADIADRPDFYFQRQEIPRLESDLLECQYDLWDQQQAIRASQKRGIWARNSDQCLVMGKCEYFGLCSNGIKLDADSDVPSGFTKLDFVHPELADDLLKET